MPDPCLIFTYLSGYRPSKNTEDTFKDKKMAQPGVFVLNSEGEVRNRDSTGKKWREKCNGNGVELIKTANA